ncbi:HEAT repeat domain-containing protein [Corynebacterium sp. J010B-136]|uniref:HEAT repeat domain-containing protein n=1 Tax=Corynebacterium sp. J010B-136 TaxID=2099401 RepID=UPI000CF9A368|nr:HEAT repeat domain-containing protein [Corynebacterium sp. J010B-136]PQM74463.1 HEAT repeat domain-containing protein [Corynebacterium sp. J010B-136]
MNSSTRLRRALMMGSNPQSGDLPVLIQQLGKEPDFFVRDMLTWAITRHPHDESFPLLVAALDDPHACAQVLHTLSKINHPDTWSVLRTEMLHDADVAIRTTAWRAAVAAVPETEVNTLVTELIQELGRGDTETQRSLIRALVALGDPARARLEAIEMQVHAALALFDDPTSAEHSNLNLARKVALYPAHGQD